MVCFAKQKLGFWPKAGAPPNSWKTFGEKIEAVDAGKLTEVAQKMLEQEQRDEQRMQFVMSALKPDIVKLQHDVWSQSQMMAAEGPWIRDQLARIEHLTTTTTQQSFIGERSPSSNSRVPRIKLPDPKSWKIDTLKGEANFGEWRETFDLQVGCLWNSLDKFFLEIRDKDTTINEDMFKDSLQKHDDDSDPIKPS